MTNAWSFLYDKIMTDSPTVFGSLFDNDNITDVTNDVKPFIITYNSTTINGGTGKGFEG